MKKIILPVLLFCLFALPATAQKKKKKQETARKKDQIELAQIWGSSTFYAKGVYGVQMLPNTEHYVMPGYNDQDNSSYILKYRFDSEKADDTLFSSKWVKTLPEGFVMEDFKISPKGNYILLQTNSSAIYRHSKLAEFYIYSLRAKKVKAVANGKQVMYANISPDEEAVAYVSDNNLFIQNFKSDQITQVTKDGEMNEIINGRTDWVYEEEFALVQGYQWSPDGERIAFLKFDESDVKLYQLAVYDSLYPTQYQYKYPKAGEDNSIVSLWIYSITDKSQKKVIETDKTWEYIPRFGWTKDNNTFYYQLMNRLQNRLAMYTTDASTLNRRTVYEETSNTYIDISDNLHFLADGSFFITSEKEGYNKIYYHDREGNQLRTLSPDNFDIGEILGVDNNHKRVYYTIFEPSSTKRTVYSVNFDGNERKPLIDGQTGRGNAQFSTGYNYFIFNYSNAEQPPVWSIYGIDGKWLRTLEDNADLKTRIAKYNFNRKEFMEIPIGKGISLNAWMIKPRDFDKKKKYPVLFSIYGGPGHQMVTDQWGGNMDMWYQHLADKGYIIVSVDNRGTGAKGADFKKSTYKKLGVLESDDQIAAAKYFANLPYIDASRIGIYGWSFGGYMSALCLMKGSDVFKMAVSVAPVTDWRYYDNIYTERYMQRPQDNKQGYDESSVLKYVPNLKGKLLLVHGSYDDNVHPQNSMELISEMIKQNKKFDSEFYPDKNHGIYGVNTRLHLYERITKYILDNL